MQHRGASEGDDASSAGGPQISRPSTSQLQVDRIVRKARTDLNGDLGGCLDAIRVACIDARSSDVRVEHLLLQFKTAWSSVQHGADHRDPREKERLDQLIGLVIQEYYQADHL